MRNGGGVVAGLIAAAGSLVMLALVVGALVTFGLWGFVETGLAHLIALLREAAARLPEVAP